MVFGRVWVEKNMEGAENPYKVRFLWRRQGGDWEGGDAPPPPKNCVLETEIKNFFGRISQIPLQILCLENYIQHLKKHIRNGKNPIVQMAKKEDEISRPSFKGSKQVQR